MISARVSSFATLEAEIQRRVKSLSAVAAVVTKKIIQDNSAKGVDFRGQKMVEYSPAYKLFRAKHGLATNPVNLRVKGNLLDKAKIVANGMKSSLEPSSDRTLIAEGNIRSRKFYPENDSDIVPSFEKALVTKLEKVISERK